MHVFRYLHLNVFVFFTLTTLSAPLFANTAMEKSASAAFAAFGIGERTGNYAGFKALISQNFAVYSHPVQPMRGVFKGASALEKLNELIAQREKTSNGLTFSNIQRFCSGDTCIFQFDSEGLIAGGFPYKGNNIIALSVVGGKVTGFREYLGDVEPMWFQKK
jgi:ketosteroid isomerase-like protein